MRPAPRRLLALIASSSLILGVAASAAAARPAEAARSSGTSYMGTLGTRGGDAHQNAGKPAGSKNLHSNGGAIQKVPAVYISYWGSEWNSPTAPSATYTYTKAMVYNNDFFGNVGGSAWNDIVTQYCMGVTKGATSCSGVSSTNFITNPTGQLGGTWIDTSTVPSSPTQTDIANAAKRLAAQFPTAVIANSTFMVYTPSGKSMSGFAATPGGSWCAWHSSTTYNGSPFAYAYIPYLPDAGTSCGMNFVNKTNDTAYGTGYFDGFSVVAGHEYSEAETDPFPSSGWVDRQGAENADKCAWSSKSANISLGAHVYAVQPTWSNLISGCPSV
ncbi:MAG: hypothetical protein ABI578_05735 [Chloroflexota bacterium]